MASSFEKSVKGATKIKLAPPKTKYIEHILIATHSGEHGVAEVLRSLQNRLRDSTWTVVFKSLITIHLMIREGSENVTLAYLSQHKNLLAISSFSDVQTQGRNIRHYANYLLERAKAYRDTKCDWVRGADRRLEKLAVNKGLLRETEAVQHQISALLKCDILDNEPENEITITAFRMLVLDLLAMFHVVNQALINILGHFFEMSRSDAERALEIYRDFAKQTDRVVGYLSTARQYEQQTRVEIPKLKHAPVTLGKQLEEYLADADFDVNRRQYLAEHAVRTGGRPTESSMGNSTEVSVAAEARVPASIAAPSKASGLVSSISQGNNRPETELIDFFDSISSSETYQPSSAVEQDTLPGTLPLNYNVQQGAVYNNDYHSASFYQQPQQQQYQQQQQMPPNIANSVTPGQQSRGGYPMQGALILDNSFQTTPQQFPSAQYNQDFSTSYNYLDNTSHLLMNNGLQQQQQHQQHQQVTNPFRQSVINPTQTDHDRPQITTPSFDTPTSQATNPFMKRSADERAPQNIEPAEYQLSQFLLGQDLTTYIQPQATGTNPFARNRSPPIVGLHRPDQPAIGPQASGNTNPFRQSTYVNTNTGIGWQTSQQRMGGGLDHLETVPIFPRPGMQQPWQ